VGSYGAHSSLRSSRRSRRNIEPPDLDELLPCLCRVDAVRGGRADGESRHELSGPHCVVAVVSCVTFLLFVRVPWYSGRLWHTCCHHSGYKIPGDKSADGTVMRCFDKEHITSWYDDHPCFMMFLQQCNAQLVRWVGVSFRGTSVPVLLEFEFDDRHDRSKRDYNRPEHFTPSRLPDQHCQNVDATEHSYMNVSFFCGCTKLTLSRQESSSPSGLVHQHAAECGRGLLPVQEQWWSTLDCCRVGSLE